MGEIEHVLGELVLQSGLLRFVVLLLAAAAHVGEHSQLQVLVVEVLHDILQRLVVGVGRQVSLRLELTREAVDEAEAEDVAPDFLGREASPQHAGSQGFAPAVNAGPAQVANVWNRLRGILSIGSPRNKEDEDLLGLLFFGAAAPGAVQHRNVRSTAGRQHPVVPVRLRPFARAQRDPVGCSGLWNLVVDAWKHLLPCRPGLDPFPSCFCELAVILVAVLVRLLHGPGMDGNLVLVVPDDLIS